MHSGAPFIVSAPGKVILFGEHSAVYHRPAIAAALGLRAYLLVSPHGSSGTSITTDSARADSPEISHNPSTISLHFPDIGLSHAWPLSDIPWDAIAPFVPLVNGKPVVTATLTAPLVDILKPLWSQVDGTLHQTACMCFLYLYVHLCRPTTSPCLYVCRLTLPIGAGLGSLASIAVCLAAAFLRLGGHIADPALLLNDQGPSDNKCVHLIDQWSLIGEMCFHGNPSGIDNAVASYGGAILYQKSLNPAEPALRVNLSLLPLLHLLLTNTKIPRSTAALVAKVATLNTAYPAVVESMFEAMSHVADEAHRILSAPFDDSLRPKLRDLFGINHGLLLAIGVSHPALEKVRMVTDTYSIGATKLTGAGGGGCAITLIDQEKIDTPELAAAIAELQQHGFETVFATLGGKGAGCVANASNVSADAFKTFKDRDEIEAAVGPSALEGWKYW